MDREVIGNSFTVTPQAYPWLLIQDQDGKKNFFFSLSEDRFYAKSIPQLEDTIIRASGFNWLVLEDLYMDSEVCYLLNLVTMEKVDLPPLQNIDDQLVHSCLLTSPPSGLHDDDSLVLFFYQESVLFCQIGDTEFTEQVLDFIISDAVLFQGKICCMARNKLVTVEMVAGSRRLNFTHWTMNESPTICPPETPCSVDYLIPFHDELLLVCKMRSGSFMREVDGFRVFRMDSEEKEKGKWVRVNCIGEKTIFLGHNKCGFCSEASETGVNKNCIYFLNYNRFVYMYNLEDESIVTQLPCQLVRSGKTHYSMWVMID